jgi:thiamine-monophosphate kinase
MTQKMKHLSEIVRNIGEQGLLKKLQKFCPSELVGDDAAILTVSPGKSLVVTTDILVNGVHFSDRTTSPEDVGWRAAAANLSDLAAMGASPLGITVGLSLPGEVSVNWVESLYEGLTQCLQADNTPIIGGDICASSVITVSITALGEVTPKHLIKRSTAEPGDAIVITGFHGLSRAGLELLLHPEKGKHLHPSARNRLIQAHQRPKARLDVIEYLKNLEGDFRRAGMDSSDGLADAVVQICGLSGVGAKIERDSIPIVPALFDLVSPEQALDWVLYGGEDFELVLCLPEQIAQKLVENLGEGAAMIGQVTTGEQVELIDSNGIYPKRILTLKEGFQHF